MAENKKHEFEHIAKEEFEFVQMGEKIYDKKFETKPIGYFHDAMIRFAKNKSNVIATIILSIIILMSIFVPILSTKNAEVQESRLAYLPPRVPWLAEHGIMDGYKYLDNQVVDLTTIDPDTGLGFPASIPAEFIDMDTLENYYTTCDDSDDDRCVGGENMLSVDNNKEHVIIQSTAQAGVSDYMFLRMNEANNAYLQITISQAILTDPDAIINIYMKASAFSSDLILVSTISGAGTYQIRPYEALGKTSVESQLYIELKSKIATDTVYFTSIEIFDDTQTDPIYSVTGYYLNYYYRMATIITPGYEDTLLNGGTWKRYNGQVLAARFSYDAYGNAFGSYTISALARSIYDKIMVDYADSCTVTWVDPADPNHYTLSEGCPVEEVLGKVGVVVIGTEEYFSYRVIANYGLMHGYDEVPYFWFGTSGSGQDLFKLIWIGTRTSLLLGLLVSAINISIGIVFGSISGYYGGNVDLIMQRFAEIVGRIPWLVTLSIFIALYGPGQVALIGVLVISGWIGVAGVTRTQFYRYKGREYVLASRTLGAGDGRLIFRHILPNGIGTIITTSILSIPGVIFTESTLSYLGFGIGHGTTMHLFGFELTGVSIGVLLSDGRNRLLYEPYLTVWPSIVISILMITFNMFGNALRDAFNPALRGSE
ncbi:MAG: ABC transporter permease [Bacilli bacterium]|nr:ABC transporter permease [Bacilli bacterium]